MVLSRWDSCHVVCGDNKECYDRCMGFRGAHDYYEKVVKRGW
ncbi:hypothetical protein [Pyrodictium delaneyi]|nr:hypothetical protein [Pyrodictium delaneyi]